jgi:hypothetical protein
MHLQFNHFKPVLFFLALLTQCALAGGQTGQPEPPATPQPADRLAQVDKGVISGNSYTNRALGFLTEFPAGWQVIDEAKQHELIETNHEATFGDSPEAQREHEWTWSCSHILLWTSQDPSNHLLVVSVWNPSCFPEIHFPASSQDHEAIQQMIERMRRPPLGQGEYIIEPDEKITTHVVRDHLLVDISPSMPYDESTKYMSIVMTPLKNYWVSWMFGAPSSDALQKLKKTVFESVKFDAP